jgi:uncharacterized protein with HEPN domain
MSKEDTIYLSHIVEAISRIEKYSFNLTKTDFMKNELVQAGSIRELEIIGEATKHLSESFKSKYSDVPWKKISGMRDKLIHDYFGVDIDAVWETIQKDIPDLQKKIQAIMKKNQIK